MATTVTVGGNYAGELAAGYIADAVLGGRTLQNETVTIHENIAGKLNLRNMDVTPTITGATCDFTADGSIVLSDIVIDPVELQINDQICKLDFIKQWESLQMRGERLGMELPADFNEFLIMRYSKEVAKNMEVKIWQGTAGAGSFDGLYTRAAASGSAIPVTSTTITAANVIGELAKMVDAMNDDVYDNIVAGEVGDGGIYIPIKTAKLYQRALGFGQVEAATNINSLNNQLTVGAKPLDFEGFPLIVCPGLAANTMLAARKSDLHFGTNLLSDQNSINIVDMTQTDASKNVRYAMQWNGDTQITNDGDIVVYKP